MMLTRVTNETGSTSSDQFRSVYFSLFQFSSCAVNKRLVEAAAAAMTRGHVSEHLLRGTSRRAGGLVF